MKDISIIIPVNEVTNENRDLITKAIEISENLVKEKGKIILVGPKDELSDYNVIKSVTILDNPGKTDFCSQVNLAVSKCKTEYFSICELDDEYRVNWFENVEKYSDVDNEISMFLPLVEVIDYQNRENGSIGYINEAVWASSFSDEIGFLDTEGVNNYPGFNMTGAVINTADFKEIGGLKPSFKVSFWYEFILRALNNDKKMYVIPKVGYYHLINRPGSLTDLTHKTVSPEEADWWISLAQQEYLFKKDRNKTYEE